MKSVLIILGLMACLFLQACEKPNLTCGCVASPLSSQLMGKWEWVKTVTPSRTITPQIMKYSRIFQHENDGSRDYIAFYRNDSLYLQLTQSRTFYQEDKKQFTVLEQYGSQYLKYYLSGSTDYTSREMQTSELMAIYSEQADTVRHYYKYKGR